MAGLRDALDGIGMAAFDAAAGFYVAVAVITLLIVFATIWVLLSTRSS